MARADKSTIELPSVGEPRYDGFISYSHAADGLLAPRLQSGLQRFAKPWWRRRALRMFRDQTSLSASPHLWTSITAALDESAWFVLLLSPDAASSQWVNQEVEYWVRHKDRDRIIPVLTEGSFEWRNGDVEGTSVPEELRGVFTEEPRWVDLRFARDEEQLDLQNARYADAIADIACTLRGLPKDELLSEEVRQHRRTMRIAWAAGIGLALLAIASAAGWTFALDQRDEARRERDLLAFTQLVNRSLDEADQDLELALLLAVESYRRIPGPESTQALLNALTRLPPGLTVFGEPAHSDTAETEFCGSTTPRPGIFVSVGDAAGEGEVVVFDAEAGEIELQTTVPFNCSARLLPDGRLLGFDTEGEPPSHLIVDSEGEVTRLPSQVRRVFNQLDDGRFLAEWSDTGSDAETGRLVVLDGVSGELVEETGVTTIELVVDPTGSRAITQAVAPGDTDSAQISTRSILDLTTFEETPLETAPEALYTWDPEGSEVLAIVGEELMRFDLSGRLIDTTPLQTEGGAPSDLSFSPEGKILAVATSAGLEVLDYPGLEPVSEPIAIDYQIGAMSMIDDDRVATQDRDGVVRVVSLSGSGTLENRVAFGGFNDSLFMLSPEYGLVWPGDDYEGYPPGIMLPVDLSTGEIFDPYAELGVQPNEHPVPMADGMWVVLSESHSRLIDESGSELLEIPRQTDQVGLANTFADGRWGHWLDAFGSDIENVTEVQITSLDVVEREVTVNEVTVSGWLDRPRTGEAGFWVQTDKGEEIEVYDWSGTVLGVIPGSTRFGSALSRDGSRLAVVQSDRSVLVYDVQSGETVAELQAGSHHEAPLFIDPEQIVVRSTDGRVALWSVATDEALGTLAEAPAWPPSLDWGTSGYEPTMSWDGASFWFTQPEGFIEITVDTSAWIEAACAAAGRSLTVTEWEELVPFDEPHRDSCEP